MAGFNPRLREGGDVYTITITKGDKSFNPRLREGGDVSVRRVRTIAKIVSIHASAREATEAQ